MLHFHTWIWIEWETDVKNFHSPLDLTMTWLLEMIGHCCGDRCSLVEDNTWSRAYTESNFWHRFSKGFPRKPETSQNRNYGLGHPVYFYSLGSFCHRPGWYVVVADTVVVHALPIVIWLNLHYILPRATHPSPLWELTLSVSLHVSNFQSLIHTLLVR